MPQTTNAIRPPKIHEVENSLANLREVLLGLRYGSVLITIHEDRIVQIDVTEKKRLKTN